MAELEQTTPIKRAHAWTPSRAGVRSVCQRCGMIKAKATTIHCYVEEVPTVADNAEPET